MRVRYNKCGLCVMEVWYATILHPLTNLFSCYTHRFEQDEQEQMICILCGTIAQDFLSQSQDVDDGGFGGAITAAGTSCLCVCMCV